MTAFYSIEVWLVALVITICVIGGFGVFARWCSQAPAVARDRLDNLRVGMTAAEIVALLGQPRDVRHTPEGRREWIYGSRMKRHVLMMQFDSHDRLLVFAHGVPGSHRRSSPGEHA